MSAVDEEHKLKMAFEMTYKYTLTASMNSFHYKFLSVIWMTIFKFVFLVYLSGLLYVDPPLRCNFVPVYSVILYQEGHLSVPGEGICTKSRIVTNKSEPDKLN